MAFPDSCAAYRLCDDLHAGHGAAAENLAVALYVSHAVPHRYQEQIFAAWRGLAQRPPKACRCLAALVAAMAWITPFASDNVNYAKHRWGLGIRDQGLGIDARPYPAGAGFGFWAPGNVLAAVHGTDRDATRATPSHRFHEDLRSYLHPASHPAAPHPSVAPCTTGLP